MHRTRMQDNSSYLSAFDTAPYSSQRLDYTPSPPQSMSPDPPSSISSNSNKAYAFVALPGNAQKKRPRRRYDEIERLYRCVYPDCQKAYGTLNHLNAHIHTQKHGKKRLPVEFKQLRKQWRKEKKDQESYCTAPQIPPPGSLDLNHYGIGNNNGQPAASSFADATRPFMPSSWTDTTSKRSSHLSSSSQRQAAYPRYEEEQEQWAPRGWNHPSSPESKPYPSSYPPAPAPAHNDYLSIDTVHHHHPQHHHHSRTENGSPLTPVTPLSNSPPAYHPSASFAQTNYTPSPPYSSSDVDYRNDSDSYRGGQEEYRDAYNYTAARSIPYPIQTSSHRPLVSSSYPPLSSSFGSTSTGVGGSDAVSPGGMSSYSAPSPPYGGHGMQRSSLFTPWQGQHDM